MRTDRCGPWRWAAAAGAVLAVASTAAAAGPMAGAAAELGAEVASEIDVAASVRRNAETSAQRIFAARPAQEREALYVESFHQQLVLVSDADPPMVLPRERLPGLLAVLAPAEGAPGVDVYIAARAVEGLQGLLSEGAPDGVALYVATHGGRAWRLRPADRGVEAQLNEGAWMRWTTTRGDPVIALELADEPLEARTLAFRVVDPDCTGDRAAPTLEAMLASVRWGRTVAAATTGDLPSLTEARRLAEAQGIDLVLVQVPDVCGDGAPGMDAALAPFRAARTAADLWAAHAGVDEGRVLTEVWRLDPGGRRIVIAGDDLVGTWNLVAIPSRLAMLAFLCCCGLPGVVGLTAGGIMILFDVIRRKDRPGDPEGNGDNEDEVDDDEDDMETEEADPIP